MIQRRSPLRRKTRIKQVSDTRRLQADIYSKRREAFLKEHPHCQAYQKIVWGAPVGITPSKDGWLERETDTPLATEIHHKAGRTGTNYLDTTTWLAVCRLSHEWIHNHPSWARKLGLLV